jgi:hypothetical protein
LPLKARHGGRVGQRFFLHFSDATALQDGVAAARRKLIRIAETRDFISSLKQ